MKYLFNTRSSTFFLKLFTLICLSLVFNTVNAHSDLQIPQKDRTVSDRLERIVGGSVVPQGQRTFQVGLIANGRQICGGSIIADSWVLTAAHCVDDSNVTQILSDTQNLNQGGQRDSIAQIIIHPNWDSNDIGDGNDVALIQINGSFESDLERLKLANQSIMSSAAGPGTGAIVSGWGLTSSGGQSSSQLLQAVNTVISDAQCFQLTGNFNSSSVICAYDQGRSSCNGDSGGPYTVNSGGQTYSIGIVSFGPRICDGYSAYTETANFVNWINQYVDTNTDDSEGGDDGDSDQGTELSNNSTISVSGNQNEMKYFTFNLPTDVSTYTVSISSGTGDADLYVRQGSRPTDLQYDCRPYRDGNSESCSETSPASGTYHVMLKGYRDFSDVSLTLNYEVSDDDNDPDTSSCPTDHELFEGLIDSDGSTTLGGTHYYSPSGTHSVINLGSTAITAQLYKWRSRWRRVQSSSSEIQYSSTSGYYRIILRGTAGTPYSVCTKTP